MEKIDIVLNTLLLEIERLERMLSFADKRRQKHLLVNEICKLEHYTDIYNYINNMPK